MGGVLFSKGHTFPDGSVSMTLDYYFFWWTVGMRKIARNGIPVCSLPGKKSKNHKYKPPIKAKTVKQDMCDKIHKVRKHRCTEIGLCSSMIRFF